MTAMNACSRHGREPSWFRGVPDSGRGAAVGLFVTALYAAQSVSLAATGGLMSVLDWRDAYLVMALVSALSLPLMLLLLRGHVDSPTRGSSGRLDLTVLKSRTARYFIMGYSLHALELYAVRVWLPVFLTTVLIARGVDDAQAVVRAAIQFNFISHHSISVKSSSRCLI